MRLAAFTVDVDRDVNIPMEGRKEAISRAVNGETGPRFSSSRRGLELLVEALNRSGIRATFFLEAETAQRISETVDLGSLLRGHEVASHGWCHEDLTGESTKVTMCAEEVGEVLDRSARVIEDVTGQRVKGFRAPYQHVSLEALDELSARGYLYDSSLTRDIADRAILPFRHPNGLLELPLARGRDAAGKRIHSYLWPMHEGKRAVADYLHLLDQYDDGVLVLATHSWHVVETYQCALGPEDSRSKVRQVEEVIQGAMARGIEFKTLEEHSHQGF